VYAPYIWWIGLVGTSVYLAGLAAVIGTAAAQCAGWGWGLVGLAVVDVADHFRSGRREAVVREILGEATTKRLDGALRLERYATPLIMAVHWLIIVSSAFGRTIHWAGVTYRLRGRQRVEVVDRG